MGQTLNPPTLAIPTSASPCLSPIRYSLDLSSINQIQSTNIDEEPIEIAQHPLHRSLPMDDSSVKVCIFIRKTSLERIILFFSQYFWLKIFPPEEY